MVNRHFGFGRIDRSTVSRDWHKDALEDAGLRDMPLHALRHTAAAATITPLENQRARIVFDEPQRAITPGQASVFYRGDEVIGGAVGGAHAQFVPIDT